MRRKEKFSVSLSKEVLASLRTAAKRENMSVNGFIGKTLEYFAMWDMHNAEFIPIRKALLSKLLDKFSPEEIDQIAKSMARTENKDTVLRVSSQYDILAVLRTFEGWLRMTGFPYSYDTEGPVHRFVMLHDLGIKWSIYLVKLFSGTIVQFDVFPKYDYTDKVLSITIDLSEVEAAREANERQMKILQSAVKEPQGK